MRRRLRGWWRIIYERIQERVDCPPAASLLDIPSGVYVGVDGREMGSLGSDIGACESGDLGLATKEDLRMLKRDEASNAPGSCWGKAREDERVFILLARDLAAPAAIRYWVELRIAASLNEESDPQIQEARSCAGLMEAEGAGIREMMKREREEMNKVDRIAAGLYGAYRAHTGGKSLATGQEIPTWENLAPVIQEAWKASAKWVLAEWREDQQHRAWEASERES